MATPSPHWARRAPASEARLEAAESHHVKELREDRDHRRVMASELADRNASTELPPRVVTGDGGALLSAATAASPSPSSQPRDADCRKP